MSGKVCEPEMQAVEHKLEGMKVGCHQDGNSASPLTHRQTSYRRATSSSSVGYARSPLSQGETYPAQRRLNNMSVSSTSTALGSNTTSISSMPTFDEPVTPTQELPGSAMQGTPQQSQNMPPAAGGSGAVCPTEQNPATSESPTDAIIPAFSAKKKKKKKKIKAPEFDQQYELTGKILGDGSYSTVKECRDLSSGVLLAVKDISKNTPEHLTQHVRDQVYKEMDLLTECKGHPNIIEFFAFFETNDSFLMVFEKVEGGELLAHIQDRKVFTEREASEVTYDIANALSFLHDKGIAHRDLKPQNILCVHRDRASPAKLCDFNLGIRPSTHDSGVVTPPLYYPVGTPEFMSPEVVDLLHGEDKAYDKRCDVWSLGVILYIMLSGSAPFTGECGHDCGWNEGKHCDRCLELLQDDILDCYINLSGSEWRSVSGAAKDLIARMLVPEHQRLSSMEVLRHPWIRQKAPQTPLETPTALRRSSIIHFLDVFTTEANQITRESDEHFIRGQSGHTRPGAISIGSVESSSLAARRQRSRPNSRRQSLVVSSFRTVQAMDLEHISTPKFK